MPFLYHMLFFAAGAILAAAVVWYVQSKRLQKAVRQREAANLELEKRMLRAQINPHFLFNALASVQHFITDNDKVSALKYLSKFSKLLRQTLEQSGHSTVLLHEEIAFLKNYLELEALRFDHAFSFRVEAEPDVDLYTVEVPILLIQPFVENAILHGLAHKKDGGSLSVRFSDGGDCTVCTIRDNGIGRAASLASKTIDRPSRGMAITERRAALLFHNDQHVRITDLYDDAGHPAGTEVVVRVPKDLEGSHAPPG